MHGIKHRGLSDYASVLPRIKFGVTGQESSLQRRSPHGAKRNNTQRFHTAKR